MQDTFGPRIAATLNHRIDEGATALQIAGVVVALCQDTAVALTPIIGAGGVGALYQRSLHLAKVAHPWIGALPTGSANVTDFELIRALLSQQTATAALAGGTEVLETFSRLLAGLIGFSLSEQLLAAVWIRPASGSSAQEVP